MLNAILPLVAIFAGAAITYWINVRQRRRTYIEDLFNAAIAAVSAAEISVDYLASVGHPTHMSDEDYAKLQSWVAMEGMKNWATKVFSGQRRACPRSAVPGRTRGDAAVQSR